MPASKKNPGKATGRKVTVKRDTKETQIELTLDIDGDGTADISTTIAFFDHLLELFTRHAGMSLSVKATGDLVHHLVEDVGIVLGQAFREALGKKVGIERYGSYYIPMDETLGFSAVDFSGRPYFVIDLQFRGERIEDMAEEDIIHFFESFALHAQMNLHVKIMYGENEHHKAEAAIKALAHAIKMACTITGDKILSTKGTL